MAEDYDAILNRIEGRGRPAAPGKGPDDIDATLSRIENRGASGPASAEDAARGGNADPGTFLSRSGNLAKGAAKGLVGEAVGAGQIASDVEEKALGTHALSNIGSTGLAQDIKRWTMTPGETTAESVGTGIGAVAPWIVAEIASGGATTLPALSTAATRLGARIANPMVRQMVKGATAGALQPTEEGTLESHEKGAKVGAVLGAAPKGVALAASRGGRILAHIARGMGIPVPHIPYYLHALARQLEHAPGNLTAAGSGVAAGQTMGPGVSNAEELYSTKNQGY